MEAGSSPPSQTAGLSTLRWQSWSGSCGTPPVRGARVWQRGLGQGPEERSKRTQRQRAQFTCRKSAAELRLPLGSRPWKSPTKTYCAGHCKASHCARGNSRLVGLPNCGLGFLSVVILNLSTLLVCQGKIHLQITVLCHRGIPREDNGHDCVLADKSQMENARSPRHNADAGLGRGNTESSWDAGEGAGDQEAENCGPCVE